jgi:diguanylate cyclase (GGDEF)-like protein
MRSADQELTLVTGFGEPATRLLGRKLPLGHGITAEVYRTGLRVGCQAPAARRLDGTEGELGARSLLGVPVVLGNSVCGVMLLINRIGRGGFSDEDGNLLQIFASYISSSIQNMLDGLRAKELARRDDLTGLFNDRYFHFRLREEIARAETHGHELTLLFLDLDHFKDVNDSFGHLEGSRVLHDVGIVIGSHSPPGSVAARYGGDEFVIILPGHGIPEATEVARRLQGLVEEAALVTESAPFNDQTGPHPCVTASVGVASLKDHVEPGTTARRANALIRIADAAMYRAKAEGRNRVIVAGDSKNTKEPPIAAPCRGEPEDAPDRGTAKPGRGSAPGACGDLPGSPGSLRDHPGDRRS